MADMTFLQNGGGWTTNIGNAFLDLGSIELLRQAFPESEVHLSSVMNRYYSKRIRGGILGRIAKNDGDISNVLNIQEYAKVDFVAQCGAFLGMDWFELNGPVLEKLVDRGVRLIITGGGMTDKAYSEEEVETVRQYLKRLSPLVFISRDRESYKAFHDLAEYSYDGIDVAFFLNDAYSAMELDIPPYVVLNFDKTTDPDLDGIDLDGRKIVRIHHSFFHKLFSTEHFKYRSHYYGKKNVMISEIPYGYLNLYAGAEEVYSDRVHACVASMVYGTQARLFSSTSRAGLLERVGLESVLSELTYPDISSIHKEKEKQVKFLSEILS